jgi:hypothetical protein
LEPKGRAEAKADPSSRDEANSTGATVEADEAKAVGDRSKRAVKTKQQPS